MTGSIPENEQATVTTLSSFRDRPERVPAKRTTKNKGMTTDELSPLVKPGEYQLFYIGRYTTYLHGHSPKLALKFRIVDQGGDHFEKVLIRWYNCRRLLGKPGNNGGFVPHRHGSFLIEYCTLFPLALTRHNRLDRISFKPFKNSIVIGRVDTVTSNSKQRELPEALQYSTIRELLKVGA